MSAIRGDEILFRGGGAEAVRSGVEFRRFRRDGSEPEGPTHTRADATTCATYVDKGGLIRTAAAAKRRASWDYALSRLGLLLEPSRINLILRSETFDNAAWTKSGATINPDQVVGADGTAAAADYLIASAGNSSHLAQQAVTVATGILSGSVHVSHSNHLYVGVGLYNATDGNFARCVINVSTGAIISSTGSIAKVIALNGYYRVVVTGTPTVANSGLYVFLTDASGNETWNAAGTEQVAVWGAQLEAGAYPSSYIKTTTAAVTRAADSLTLPIGFAPQDLTVYARVPRPVWADASGSIGDPRLLLGINSGTGYFQIFGEAAARNLIAGFNSGSTVEASAAIPAGTSIEICAQFANLTTAGKARIDVGSGFGSYSSTASTALSTWGANTLAVGFGTSANREWGGGIERLLIGRGLFTLAECQAVYG